MGSRWQKVGGVERPPITSAITNPAPIERGLVMDEWSTMPMQPRLRCLARNLRDAAGCALAYDLGCSAEYARTPWDATLAGRPAPGWER